MTPRLEDIREQLLPRLRAWGCHGIHIGLSPRAPAGWKTVLDPAQDGSIRTYAGLDGELARRSPIRRKAA